MNDFELILVRQIINVSLQNNEQNMVNCVITNDEEQILIKNNEDKIIGKLNINQLDILKKQFFTEKDLENGDGTFLLNFQGRKIKCTFNLNKKFIYIKLEEFYNDYNNPEFIFNETLKILGIKNDNKTKYILFNEKTMEEGVCIDFVSQVKESTENLVIKFKDKFSNIKETFAYNDFEQSENQLVLDCNNTLWYYKKSNILLRENITNEDLRYIKSNKELKDYFIKKNYVLETKNITKVKYKEALEYVKLMKETKQLAKNTMEKIKGKKEAKEILNKALENMRNKK